MTRWHHVSPGNRTAWLGTTTIYQTSSLDEGVFPTSMLWLWPFPTHPPSSRRHSFVGKRHSYWDPDILPNQRHEHISGGHQENVWISNGFPTAEHVESKLWMFSKYTSTSIPPSHREATFLHILQALPYSTVKVPSPLWTWKPPLGHLQQSRR